MSYCTNCGNEAPLNANFCPYCGQKLFHPNALTNKNLCASPDNDHKKDNDQCNEKWYQIDGVVLFFLLFLWPVGLVLMWVNRQWDLTKRITATIIIAVLMLFMFLYKFYNVIFFL